MPTNKQPKNEQDYIKSNKDTVTVYNLFQVDSISSITVSFYLTILSMYIMFITLYFSLYLWRKFADKLNFLLQI